MASPGTMLTRAICPVAWGSEVMIAGFPTIACRRLNAIVSRLQVGDCGRIDPSGKGLPLLAFLCILHTSA